MRRHSLLGKEILCVLLHTSMVKKKQKNKKTKKSVNRKYYCAKLILHFESAAEKKSF